jgi:peptidoglycan/xylan/chitin deacetylase (PgdA/CDA1 family)
MTTIYSKHGNLIRILYLIGAIIWYLLTIGGRLWCRKTVVLCYHGIRLDHQGYFRRQISWIRNRRFGLQRFSRITSSEVLGLPKICITFDDAFENLLDNALPLLNELRVPAIVFAVPGNLGQSPKWNIAAEHPEYNEKIMTAQQIKNIHNDLIKIGSHTQTHPNLSELSVEDIRRELEESKNNLEKLLDKPIEDLALPHGAYNEDVLRIAQETGYKRIYTLEPKIVKENQETGVLGRFSMSPDVWQIEFYLTCAGAYSWLFPFRRFVKQVGL